MKLAGQAHGEIANVDHFLHLAETFLVDLAKFKGEQQESRSQICFMNIISNMAIPNQKQTLKHW